MFKKVIFSLIWFPIAFLVLLFNISFLWTYTQTNNAYAKLSTEPETILGTQVTSAISTSAIISTEIIPADSRPILIESFLSKHGSPMAPYSQYIVENADRHNLDFRLITAIAMCESNAGKRMPKSDGYNPFGIAVYTNDSTGKKFNDWPHAIEWASQYIQERFYNQGIQDLTEIGRIWAPPSAENGDSWSNCVSTFIDRIQ